MILTDSLINLSIPIWLNIPLVIIDLFSFSFTFGSTFFLFFIQSPYLLEHIGKEKFIPIQLFIINLYFHYIQIPLLINVVCSLLICQKHSQEGFIMFASICLAAVAGFINKEIIIPKLIDLNTGKDNKSNDKSKSNIQSSKFWQKIVILLVILLIIGMIGHIYGLVQFLSEPSVGYLFPTGIKNVNNNVNKNAINKNIQNTLKNELINKLLKMINI